MTCVAFRSPGITLPLSTRDRCTGFTLLELLAALAILAVLVGLAQVNLFDDDRRRLYREGERLATLIEAMADEAMVRGRPMALRFTAQGYTPLLGDGRGGWRAPDDPIYRSRTLPPGVRILAVRSHAQRVDGAATLVFPPTGLRPAFEIDLGLASWRLRVQGEVLGALRLVEATS